MKIVIIGGRGNGTVIASTIEDCSRAGQNVEVIGFMNDVENQINGYPVIGKIRDMSWKNMEPGIKFIYALSNVKQAKERYELLYDLSIPIERYATIVHPTAAVSQTAKLGHGVVLMPMTVVGSDVAIGNHSQLFAQSFVGHDTSIQEMVFVANNASIGGRVVVENGAHIGSNCSIRERLTVGSFSVIGLGSVVLNDVEPSHIYVGNPARKFKMI